MAGMYGWGLRCVSRTLEDHGSPGEAGARATFNPHYPDLERRIGEFLSMVDGRHVEAAAPHRIKP